MNSAIYYSNQNDLKYVSTVQDIVDGLSACVFRKLASFGWCLAIVPFAATFFACVPQSQSQPMPQRGIVQTIPHIGGSILLQSNSEKITVNGVRVSMGDAVECPRIRSDDGTETPVSYLAPDIALGDRVEVTGFMAVTTSCRGKVLYVEEVRSIHM